MLLTYATCSNIGEGRHIVLRCMATVGLVNYEALPWTPFCGTRRLTVGPHHKGRWTAQPELTPGFTYNVSSRGGVCARCDEAWPRATRFASSSGRGAWTSTLRLGSAMISNSSDQAHTRSERFHRTNSVARSTPSLRQHLTCRWRSREPPGPGRSRRWGRAREACWHLV